MTPRSKDETSRKARPARKPVAVAFSDEVAGVIEKKIGYAFRDRKLLREALTHSSSTGRGGRSRSNERLEFLGDRVLGLLIAEKLYQTYPSAPEGELALRLNALVRYETCAQVAGAIGLGKYLILSQGEADAGGREKPAILADACEALIAAVYLDGGLEAIRPFVEAHWDPLVNAMARLPRDAKTALQEWAQKQGKALPKYRLVETSGPAHAPQFVVELSVEGLNPVAGQGSSKRIAQQNAARRMLLDEGVWGGDEA